MNPYKRASLYARQSTEWLTAALNGNYRAINYWRQEIEEMKQTIAIIESHNEEIIAELEKRGAR